MESEKEVVEIPEKVDKIVTDLFTLRKISKPTSLEELEKINFKTRIQNALTHSWTKGYGLAAIQIGLPIRAAWFKIQYQKYAWEKLLFNPVVLDSSGVFYFPDEGCLSIPGKRMTTKRANKITVRNGDGEIIEATGLQAVVLQHEIDHMNGHLCIDHIMRTKDLPGRNEACPCASGKKYKKCCLK